VADVPDRRDVQEDVGLPAHLLGLVRLEQVELRRPQPFFARAKARRLRLARISPRRVGKKPCRALDPPLVELSPRLRLTASHAQLIALIRVCEFENFTLVARSLELSQPTVHRAISQLEPEAGRPLFQRTPFGLVASRAARDLPQAARLAFHELEQAVGDLAEIEGGEVGKIVIGALPMSRSVLLPGALAAFRRRRAIQPVHVVDAFFMDAGVAPANSIIEAGSILLMREMLSKGDFLGCISALQAAAEIRHGLIRHPDVPARWTPRPIGCASPTADRVRCARSGATTSVSWRPVSSNIRAITSPATAAGGTRTADLCRACERRARGPGGGAVGGGGKPCGPGRPGPVHAGRAGDANRLAGDLASGSHPSAG